MLDVDVRYGLIGNGPPSIRAARRRRRSRGPTTCRRSITARLRLVPITLDDDRRRDASRSRRRRGRARRRAPRCGSPRRRARFPDAWPNDELVARAFPFSLDAIRAAPDTRLWGDSLVLLLDDRRASSAASCSKAGRPTASPRSATASRRLARPGPRDRGDARVRRVGARASRHPRGPGDDVPVAPRLARRDPQARHDPGRDARARRCSASCSCSSAAAPMRTGFRRPRKRENTKGVGLVGAHRQPSCTGFVDEPAGRPDKPPFRAFVFSRPQGLGRPS